MATLHAAREVVYESFASNVRQQALILHTACGVVKSDFDVGLGDSHEEVFATCCSQWLSACSNLPLRAHILMQA